MKLTINKEFVRRHLFAVVVFAGMGLWFGYDGFVRYPAMSPAALYTSIESAEPPAGMSDAKLEAFKRQKIATQHGLCYALLFVAAAIGLHLFAVSRMRLAFDDAGFTWKGRRYAFGDIKSVDRSRWARKGILKLVLQNDSVTLDAWHHVGVTEFEKRLVASDAAVRTDR